MPEPPMHQSQLNEIQRLFGELGVKDIDKGVQFSIDILRRGGFELSPDRDMTAAQAGYVVGQLRKLVQIKKRGEGDVSRN